MKINKLQINAFGKSCLKEAIILGVRPNLTVKLGSTEEIFVSSLTLHSGFVKMLKISLRISSVVKLSLISLALSPIKLAISSAK